jgi:electron transfer flavoprotein alpha subunit
MTTMQIFIYIEPTEEKIDPMVRQIAVKARNMGFSTIRGIAVGNHLKGKEEQLSGFLDELLVVDAPSGSEYSTEIIGNVLTDLLGSAGPSLLFLSFTHQGMELGPVVAYRLAVPLMTACSDFKFSDVKGEVVRLIHAAKVEVTLEVNSERGAVLSVQKGALRDIETEGFGALSNAPPVRSVPWKETYGTAKSQVVGIIGENLGEGEDIGKARILVSVGRGLGDPDNLPVAQELAAQLGGMLSCSRPVVDMGWLPARHQVGLSGKSVSPTVYLALAISGQANHLAGMETSKIIIAVNKDPQAPIFQLAHYGVIDDIHQFMPQMIEALKLSKE